ncbi:uncharacterized protein LOC117509727 [Thalassophryne amazonica]|uniref:uncharacterized protein LOC117509727 n=1 Tax=Thalassophryne amazonica TaxID=390379 RepID=UPI0014723969|nr:uncharacterized protein LOC117509727 [Thalassophryne amazonica]
MNIHCPNSVPTSKYLLYKSVEDSMYEVHYYCMACTAYLGPEKLTRNCTNCSNEFSADISTAEGSFFLRMPVKTQLQRMMKVPEVAAALENRNIDEILRETNINDIVHGKLYKNLLHDGIIGPSDLSLLFNTDGVSIFKSSNFSVWPLFATVNEIPPHMRRKHMIMAGLWFGECKPNMNTFLKPFVDELRDLGADGLHSPLGQTRIFALCLSADAPARSLVRNSKQFNGKYGCDWCKQEGTPIPNGNGPPIRTYPYSGEALPRTDDDQRRLSIESQRTGMCQQGVKGPSVVMQLPHYDSVKGICSESQHTAFLGVTRHFVGTWLDSANRAEAYYIGDQVKKLDERLQDIAPPSEITRCPRSLKTRKYWKASEWRALLFYSLVVFQGI